MADAPEFDPSKPFETVAPEFDPSKPFDTVGGKQYGALESAGEGALAGASANFRDEIYGASKASGLPDWLGGFRAPVGAARLAYEHMTGQPGAATDEYNKARQTILDRQKAMHEQHPYAYGAGEIGGGLGSLALAPEIKGATMGARALQASKIGAGYGAASAAGASEGEDRATSAIIGGVTGGITGGLTAPAAEIAGNLISKASAPIRAAIRGIQNPEGEAASRVVQAQQAGAPQVAAGKAQAFTPQELTQDVQAGRPGMLADVGGAPTTALLRSAANTSPEARDVIESAMNSRFTSQSERMGTAIRDLTPGGANTAKTKAQLEAEYNLERTGAYQRAYEAGDRPIMSPELERLSSSPTVSSAMSGALNRWRDWQVLDGYGSMNPPVDPKGIIERGGLINSTGGKMPVYPNLQWWDYTSRTLAGLAAEARRAGNTPNAALYGGLEKQLKSALDKQVPEFAQARGVASQYFGGNNVIEAGADAVASKDMEALRQTMAKMGPAEKEMFQEAYADKFATNIEGLADRTDATRKILQSPLERKKIDMVFGPGGAGKLEELLRRENIYDMSRKALGNSTTVRQLIEMGLAQGAQSLGTGLAGAAAGEYFGGAKGAIEGGILGAAGKAGVPIARAVGSHAISYAERGVAKHVAEMLTSNDQTKVNAALKMIASNPRLKAGMRTIESTLAAYAGKKSASAVPAIEDMTRATGGSVKLSHKAVSYGKGHGVQFCHTCKFSDHKPRPTCQWVVDITRDGWCTLWKR